MSPHAPEFERVAVDGPLRIDGALACDAVVPRLLQRLLSADDTTLAVLRAVVAPRLVIVLGPAEALPWVDGVRYLCRAPDEPNLLLPTDTRMRMDAAMVLRAFVLHADRPRPPLVLIPEAREFVSVAAARPIERERVRLWIEGGHG